MDSHVYVSTVVHSFRDVLAFGVARAGAVPVHLAAFVAIQDCGNRGGWRSGTGEGDHLSACATVAWPHLTAKSKISGRTVLFRMLKFEGSGRTGSQ